MSEIPGPVIDAARRLAAGGRLRSASMEELAREAGVSRVTLYRRGATRAAIVAALRERLAQEEREALWPALAADGTARERLEAALALVCRHQRGERSSCWTRSAPSCSDEIYHEPGDEALTRPEFTAPFRRLLLDGAVDGTLRAVDDVDEAATVLYNGVYLDVRAPAPPPPLVGRAGAARRRRAWRWTGCGRDRAAAARRRASTGRASSC